MRRAQPSSACALICASSAVASSDRNEFVITIARRPRALAARKDCARPSETWWASQARPCQSNFEFWSYCPRSRALYALRYKGDGSRGMTTPYNEVLTAISRPGDSPARPSPRRLLKNHRDIYMLFVRRTLNRIVLSSFYFLVLVTVRQEREVSNTTCFLHSYIKMAATPRVRKYRVFPWVSLVSETKGAWHCAPIWFFQWQGPLARHRGYSR